MNTLLILLALMGGFGVGVLVNLLADYLPAQRLYREARASPFVSKSALPAIPHFLPHYANTPDRPAPIYTWSGLVARLSGKGTQFSLPRWTRRIAVEVGLALAYTWLVATYGDSPLILSFFLFYAPALILIAVIDIEHRWILVETLWPIAVVALIDAGFSGRLSLVSALRGALIGFGIMVAVYLLGQLFRQGSGALGRRIGRTVFGSGDVWLGALGGLLIGWPESGIALLLAVFAAAIGAIVVIGSNVARKKRYRGGAAIPYGPYLVFGIAALLFTPWLVGGFVSAWLNFFWLLRH